MTSPQKGKKAYIIRSRNRLKEMAQGGTRGESTIDPALIEKAIAEVQNATENFTSIAAETIATLRGDLSKAGKTQERAPHIKRIQDQAHELRNQGGTFGYPLLSRVAKSLYDYCETRRDASDDHLTVIKVHVDTLGGDPASQGRRRRRQDRPGTD